MRIDDLIDNYPYLYHMAESGSWPNIKKYGLLSTTALLDMYNIRGEERNKIESCIRPQSVTINNKKYRHAVIRDQKPLSEKKLIYLLDGITPKQFYKLLNQRTFFWVKEERLIKLLRARAYRNKSHDVLTVDTEKLVKKYEDKITLCKINSGATSYKIGRRGRQSFEQIKKYPFNEYKKTRGKNAIVELAVDYGIPDIKNYVLQVDVWSKGEKIKNIWKK